MSQLQGAVVVMTGAQPSNRNQPLSTIAELLSRLLALPGAIGGAPSALECLRGLVLGTSRDGALPITLATDSEATRALIRWSLADLLDAVASEAPLLLFLDDAQYADDATLRLLAEVFRSIPKSSVGLLCAARELSPDSSSCLRDLQEACELHRMLPLEDSACADLVDNIASSGEERLGSGTRDRIVQLSGGNPLLLLELLRHRRDLREGGELPVTIGALLHQRLRQLPPGALRLLQWCAILGPSATMRRIQRCSRANDSELVQALSELHASGMLRNQDAVLRCRHELLAEAALESAGSSVLRFMHERAAELLGREALRSSSIPHLWQSLHHWRMAGTPEGGTKIAVRLARRLLAAGHASDSVTLLQDLEPSCASPSARRLVLYWIARGAHVHHDWKQVAGVASAYRLLGETAPAEQRGFNDLELLDIEAQWYLSGPTDDLDRRLLACIHSSTAGVRRQLQAGVIGLMQAANDGREDLARQIYDEVRHFRPTSRTSMMAQLTCGMIFEADFGDMANVETVAADLVRLTRSMSSPTARAVVLRRASHAFKRAGNLSDAISVARESLALISRLRLGQPVLPSLELLFGLAVDQGDFESASRWLNEARGVARDRDTALARLVLVAMESRLAFEFDAPDCVSEQTWQFDSSSAQIGIRRMRQLILVSHAALHTVAKNSSSLLALLPELLELHRRLHRLGSQDYPVSLLAGALLTCGERQFATQLLTDYLSSGRRDRGVWPPALARLAASLVPSATPAALPTASIERRDGAASDKGIPTASTTLPPSRQR